MKKIGVITDSHRHYPERSKRAWDSGAANAILF